VILHQIRQTFRRGYSDLVARQSLQNNTIREKSPTLDLGVVITGEMNKPLALTWNHVKKIFYCYAIGVILSLLCFNLLAGGLQWRQRKTPLVTIKIQNKK